MSPCVNNISFFLLFRSLTDIAKNNPEILTYYHNTEVTLNPFKDFVKTEKKNIENAEDFLLFETF